MKIAFVTPFDLLGAMKRSEMWRNPYLVSFYTARALANFAHIEYVSINTPKNGVIRFIKYKHLLHEKLFHTHCMLNREPSLLKHYGRQIANQLTNLDVDIVFSSGTIPIAYLECKQPIVFWSDATFAGMVDFYPRFTNLCRTTLKRGHAMENSSLQRCAKAIYTSDWAAATAVSHYNVDPAKVEIIPRGPIIENTNSLADVKSMLKSKPSGECHLLFIGNDWIRKGGNIALAIAEQLNRQGLKTKLTIIGAIPDEVRNSLPPFAHPMGFISKANKKGRNAIHKLLAESHFLLAPSRAETFGISYCEASAYGVPSIAADVGGVKTVIRDDINGKLFSLSADIQSYCRYILDLMSDRLRYEELALSSYKEYTTRFSWTVVSAQLMNTLTNAES
ncbi:MAG: glycosyltransferase family 4 protein [Chloroflexi bacterium]|nr:glycosyltransferase family 4 protein [Chloroflexota bacterium]